MAKTTNPTPPSDDSNNSDRDADTDRDAETDTDVSNGQISNVQRGDLNDTSSSADDTAILPTVLPTEQIPADPTPVSATAAASGGATGLGSDTGNHQQSVFRRHPIATGVAAGVIAVVLVSGLTAWGVGTAVSASLTSSATQVAPMPSATPAPAAGGRTATGRVAFRATIKSMSGSGTDATWTITTQKGQSVTVALDSSTQFGTKKITEDASSFAVGDTVVIIATRSATGSTSTATATRVVNASALKGKLGARLGSGAGTSTGANGTTTPSTPTPAPTSTTTS